MDPRGFMSHFLWIMRPVHSARMDEAMSEPR